MSGKDWRAYTKQELRGFDADATRLILWAQERGCVTHVSRKGHAVLRSPNGKTTAVPRLMKSRNRAAQNSRAQVRRILRDDDSN